MKIGHLIILGGLVYIAFFNGQSVEMSVKDKTNKQVASIGLNGRPDAARNREVSLQLFTGFFLGPLQESIYINPTKGLFIHGDTTYNFKVVHIGVNYILIDYKGFGNTRDYLKVEPQGNIAVIAENAPLSKTVLKRVKSQP